MKLAIFGTGGFGREVLALIDDLEIHWMKNNFTPAIEEVIFVVDDTFYSEPSIANRRVVKLSEFDPFEFKMIVAVGNSIARKRVVESLPRETAYCTIIAKSVENLHVSNIGAGSIVCSGAILTTNIVIGKHAHLNLNTTIGHDCRIGDFFTTAPGVHISGNVTIGNNVYIGTGSCVKEKITICDDVIIGMSAAVLKDITEPGIYVGIPAKKLIK